MTPRAAAAAGSDSVMLCVCVSMLWQYNPKKALESFVLVTNFSGCFGFFNTKRGNGKERERDKNIANGVM